MESHVAKSIFSNSAKRYSPLHYFIYKRFKGSQHRGNLTRGYSRFQVTGMMKGIFFDFGIFFWELDFSRDFWGYSKDTR